MKVTIEFQTDTPAEVLGVLDEVKQKIMHEFNPGEWKRPCRIQFGAVTGRGYDMKIYHVTVETKETP